MEFYAIHRDDPLSIQVVVFLLLKSFDMLAIENELDADAYDDVDNSLVKS